MEDFERIQKMHGCLFHSYYESDRMKKKPKGSINELDHFLYFAWYNTNFDHHQNFVFQETNRPLWIPFPNEITLNHTVWNLKFGRSKFGNLFRSGRWLEKKVVNEFQFFEYFTKRAVFETILNDKIYRFYLDGATTDEPPGILYPKIDLRILISELYFLKHFASVVGVKH